MMNMVLFVLCTLILLIFPLYSTSAPLLKASTIQINNQLIEDGQKVKEQTFSGRFTGISNITSFAFTAPSLLPIDVFEIERVDLIFVDKEFNILGKYNFTVTNNFIDEELDGLIQPHGDPVDFYGHLYFRKTPNYPIIDEMRVTINTDDFDDGNQQVVEFTLPLRFTHSGVSAGEAGIIITNNNTGYLYVDLTTLSWGVNALQLQLSGPLISFIPLPKQSDAFCIVESTQAPTFLSTTTTAQRDTMFFIMSTDEYAHPRGTDLSLQCSFPVISIASSVGQTDDLVVLDDIKRELLSFVHLQVSFITSFDDDMEHLDDADFSFSRTLSLIPQFYSETNRPILSGSNLYRATSSIYGNLLVCRYPFVELTNNNAVSVNDTMSLLVFNNGDFDFAIQSPAAVSLGSWQNTPAIPYQVESNWTIQPEKITTSSGSLKYQYPTTKLTYDRLFRCTNDTVVLPEKAQFSVAIPMTTDPRASRSAGFSRFACRFGYGQGSIFQQHTVVPTQRVFRQGAKKLGVFYEQVEGSYKVEFHIFNLLISAPRGLVFESLFSDLATFHGDPSSCYAVPAVISEKSERLSPQKGKSKIRFAYNDMSSSTLHLTLGKVFLEFDESYIVYCPSIQYIPVGVHSTNCDDNDIVYPTTAISLIFETNLNAYHTAAGALVTPWLPHPPLPPKPTSFTIKDILVTVGLILIAICVVALVIFIFKRIANRTSEQEPEEKIDNLSLNNSDAVDVDQDQYQRID